jgi:DNA-binding response OmpR family regulator
MSMRLRGQTVLVVEDDPMTVKLLTILLRAEGARVMSAGAVDEAEALLAATEPQLVLIDVALPGFNGLELARRLRAHPAREAMTVVAVTSWVGRDAEAAARGSGCDGYVAKPFDGRTLVSTLLGFVRRAYGGAN